MTNPSEIPVRRIFVALDASSLGLAALETATSLAAELEAELRVLFVEDENLLRLAGLPFAQEIEYASASLRRLDRTEMERKLQAKAERVRRTLAHNVRNETFNWTFHITRGHLTRATMEAATEAGLLFMGRESCTLRPLRQSARARGKRPIVVAYDGGEPSQQALEVAATIARRGADQILILITETDRQRFDELRRQSTAWLAAHGIDASCFLTPIPDQTALCSVTRGLDAKLLVINQESRLIDDTTIEMLVSELDCPVGLVR